MLQQCGDTFDYIRRVLPKHVLDAYKRDNATVDETWQCMKTFAKQVKMGEI